MSQLETEVDGITMGEVLRCGFKLSLLEWALVLACVANDENSVLDNLMMGRIYRVVTLFRTLGWTVLDGLAVLEVLSDAIDKNLKEYLCKSNLQANVLAAMNRLSWLADWMTESEFSIAEVITILTDTPFIADPNQDTINWVLGFQQGLEATAVTASDFFSYTEWKTVDTDSDSDSSSDTDSDTAYIAIETTEWMTSLQAVVVSDSTTDPQVGIIDSAGLLRSARRVRSARPWRPLSSRRAPTTRVSTKST